MTDRSLRAWFPCPMLLLTGWLALGGNAAAQAPPEVVVCKPIIRAVTDYEDFVGRTEAVAVVEIRSQVSGQLEKVGFQDGALVSKGDLLFEIDPRPYQADLAKADAEVKRCEARLTRATKALEGAKRLHDNKAISDNEVDLIAADHDAAEAATVIARADRDRARLNLDSTRINAPIGGRIGRALLSPGNLVTGGTTPLATIVSVDRLYAEFDIDERTLLRLRKMIREGKIKAKGEADLPVLMGLADDAGFPYRGQIDFVDNRVDPNKGTLRMRAVFENEDHALMPGMYARIRLVTSEPHEAILIPQQAVDQGSDGAHVFIVTDKNTIEYRAVKRGSLYDGLQAVGEGLAAGEWVVSFPGALRPGMTVKPKPVEMSVPPSFSQNQPQPEAPSSPGDKK